jgi:hypothetical protein
MCGCSSSSPLARSCLRSRGCQSAAALQEHEPEQAVRARHRPRSRGRSSRGWVAAGGGPVLAYANAGQNFTVFFDRESSVTPSQAGGSADMTAVWPATSCPKPGSGRIRRRSARTSPAGEVGGSAVETVGIPRPVNLGLPWAHGSLSLCVPLAPVRGAMGGSADRGAE